jgi:hypothetical protein
MKVHSGQKDDRNFSRQSTFCVESNLGSQTLDWPGIIPNIETMPILHTHQNFHRTLASGDEQFRDNRNQ